MKRAMSRWMDRATLFGRALGLALVIGALTPLAAGAICRQCILANDTTSSGGIVSIGRQLWRGFAPPVAFVGVDGRLRCAVPDGASWEIEIADPTSSAGGVSLELDAAHEPHIAYHDAGGTVWFARRLATGWVREPVDPVSVVLGRISLTSAHGTFAAAYLDVASGQLKYAHRDAAGNWQSRPVAWAGDKEIYPSLVVDGAVRAIAYYDAGGGDLRLALSFDAESWTSSVVDSVGDVGGYASLLGGPSQGGFGIAYYDFGNEDLRYTFGLPAAWTTQNLEGAGASVGKFCSAVAFGGTAADEIGIAYYDQTEGALEYARKQGSWTFTVLDSVDDAGVAACAGATRLPDDTLGVAHVDAATGDLEYEWRAGGVTAVERRVTDGAELRVVWSRATDGAGGRLLFTVPRAGPVRVTLYDAQGRLVAVPHRGDLPVGATEIGWDGRDQRGARVADGVYFARVESPGASGKTVAIVTR